MSINITKKDVIWNYAGTVMTLATSLLLLPLIMRFLTGDELGLWYTFLSIGAIVNLFDFGFSPTLARNIAYCWGGAKSLTKEGVVRSSCKEEPNIQLMLCVIKVCKIIYFLIAGVALLLLVTFGSLYISYITREMSASKYIIAWYIYCFAIFINLYFGYYTSFLRGVGAVSEYNKAVVFSRFSQISISIVLLLSDWGIIAVAVAFLFNGFLFRVLAKKYFYEYENIGNIIRDKKVVIDKMVIRNTFDLIWHNAWRDGLVSLSNFLSTQATTLLCSAFLSLTETGIYSISIQLVTGISSFATVPYNAYQPLLQEIHLDGNTNKAKKIMSKIMCFFWVIFIIGALGLIYIGAPILNIIKPDIIFDKNVIAFMSFSILLTQRHTIYASYISNTNRILYVKSYLISSALSIIFSIILLLNTSLGLWGILLPSFIIQLLYNNWKWPAFVKKELNWKRNETSKKIWNIYRKF